jgi:hypothetical protein
MTAACLDRKITKGSTLRQTLVLAFGLAVF